MPRYVFFPQFGIDAKSLVAARRIARAQGATVMRVVEGAMLLEATELVVSQLAQALPGWGFTVERYETRVPERRMQRSTEAGRSKR